MKPTGLLDRTHAAILALARVMERHATIHGHSDIAAQAAGIIAGLEGEALAKGSTDGDILPAIAKPRCECKLSPHGADGCRRTAFDKFTRDGMVVWLCDLCDLTADVRVADEPAVAAPATAPHGGNEQGPMPFVFDDGPDAGVAPRRPDTPAWREYCPIDGTAYAWGCECCYAHHNPACDCGRFTPAPDSPTTALAPVEPSAPSEAKPTVPPSAETAPGPLGAGGGPLYIAIGGDKPPEMSISQGVSEHRIGQRVSVRVAIPNLAEGTRIGTVTGMDMYAVDIGLGFPIAVRAEDVEGCE